MTTLSHQQARTLPARWQASNYNLFVPLLSGRHLAYNTFTGGLATWDPVDQQTFEGVCHSGSAALNEGRVRQLIEGGWLVRNGADELAAIERAYYALRRDYRRTTLTIAPTMACDFDCDYCYQGSNKPAGSMTPEVQAGILELMRRLQNGTRRLDVVWYGGEPTLEMSIVAALSDRLIDFCTSRRIHYQATIITNGYRLNVENARQLANRRVKTVQITLDGAHQDHDHRRHLISGKGTFERIVQNITAIVAEVPLSFHVRVNIDERNAEGVRRLLEHLAQNGLANSTRLRVYFAPVESKTERCHTTAQVILGKENYALLEAELSRFAFEVGLTGLPDPPRHQGVCAAVRPRGFVLTPNGDIHKCWNTAAFPLRRVGTVFDLDALDDDARVRDWLGWTPFANTHCVNCRILPLCGGFCAHKSLYPTASKGAASRQPCPSWKYNLKERLLLRAEKMGAIRQNEIDPQVVRTRPSDMLIRELYDQPAEPWLTPDEAMGSGSVVTSRQPHGAHELGCRCPSVPSRSTA